MPASQRLDAIDQFRGFAILTMVLANYLARVEWIPAWMKHAPDVGLTVVDLVAPFFIFSIGLTYGAALRRRVERDGWRAAAWHFIRRYLTLIGIGALLSAGEIAFGISTTGVAWGVLQSIGVAGLVTLMVIRFPAWVRAVIGGVILSIYQILVDYGWRGIVLASPHGGLHGSIAWAALLILATALADVSNADRHGKPWFGSACVTVLLVGLALSPWVEVSKNRVSASYILINLGISGLLFSLFDLLVNRLRIRLPLLSAWGKNPILLYVLHLVLLGIMVLPDVPAWYAQAAPWLVSLQALGLIAALSMVAWQLEIRRLVLSL